MLIKMYVVCRIETGPIKRKQLFLQKVHS